MGGKTDIVAKTYAALVAAVGHVTVVGWRVVPCEVVPQGLRKCRLPA